MTSFHPDIQWLSEYTAGTLSESHALCIAAHLAYCPQCQQEAARLTQVGAKVFDTATTQEQSSAATLQRVLSNLPTDPANSPDIADTATTAESATNPDPLPKAIQKLAPDGIGHLRWKKVAPRISIANLANFGDQRDVALHRLQPGGTVSHHDHGGREVTVVLQGSFSDHDGVYQRGDFLVRDPGETHRPSVMNNEDCLCLTVCDAPVKFTGFFTRLLNPLLNFQHRH